MTRKHLTFLLAAVATVGFGNEKRHAVSNGGLR